MLPEQSFSRLVKTFIHDYVITPTGIPNFGSSAEQAEKLGLAEAAPTDLDERMKLVEEAFAAMARELRTEAIHRNSIGHKPY